MVKKRRTKTKIVIFTALLTILMGVGIVLVAEDLAGVPYVPPDTSMIDPSLFADLLLNDFTFETITRILAEHPDWAESIAKFIVEHFDISQLSMEDLQRLIQMFPGMEQYLGALLLSQLLNAGDIQQLPEPPHSGGLIEPTIDNGELDLSTTAYTLFKAQSSIRGQVYIRSCSWGDYDPAARTFESAPAFDGSTYVTSPAFFASYAALSSGRQPASITFSLGSHRDYGTLVGDLPDFKYTLKNSSMPALFSPDAENRAWLIDASDYTVSFWPNFDFSTASIQHPTVQEDEARYRRYVRKNYLDVPESEIGFLNRFLSTNRLTTVDQVVSYLKNNFTYADKSMSCPTGRDIVEYFLYENKEGTCSNFASATVLLCRALGTPARFVTGYAPTFLNTALTDVTDHDAHAWAEVYVNGVGWRRVDATPSAPMAELPTTEEPDGYVNRNLPSRATTRALFDLESSISGPIYLREYSYGDYDPVENRFSPELKENAPSGGLKMLSSLLPKSGMETVHVSHASDFSPLGMLEASYGYGSYSLYEDIRDYVATGEFEAADDQRYVRQVNSYTQQFDRDVDFDYLAGGLEDSSYWAFVNRNYSSVPSSLRGTLQAYIDYTKVASPEDIEATLSAYHTLAQGYVTDDPIAELLNGSHQGNEKSFAAAMVLLCRALGYKARFVQGYVFSSPSPAVRRGSVSRQDARAWVEVYRRGKGWERFDPMAKERHRYEGELLFRTHDTDPIVYDGHPHTPSMEECITLPEDLAEHLLPGDTVVIEFTKSCFEKVAASKRGYPIRIASIQVLDYWGDDVTSEYPGIAFANEGKMVISPREITVRTNDDKQPVSNEATRAIEPIDNLADGDYVDPDSVIFRAIDVFTAGEYVNALDENSFRILDASGNPATSNYAIRFVYGTITIEEDYHV